MCLQALHREFWTQFLRQPTVATSRFADSQTTNDHFIRVPARDGRVFYAYIARVPTSGVALDIESKSGDGAFENAVFDFLQGRRVQIENDYGRPLVWDRNGRDGSTRSSRIHDSELPGGCRSDRGQWPQIQQGMIAAMTRFERALDPHLAEAVAQADRLP